MIYLALYKGRKSGKSVKALSLRFVDWVIRKATDSEYSHCEIAVSRENGLYECYSASYRDGGVRWKVMALPADKWDLIELSPNSVFSKRLEYLSLFRRTRTAKYDLTGALCTNRLIRRLGFKQSPRKYFCSEWCGAAMGVVNPELCSPGDLVKILNERKAA